MNFQHPADALDLRFAGHFAGAVVCLYPRLRFSCWSVVEGVSPALEEASQSLRRASRFGRLSAR